MISLYKLHSKPKTLFGYDRVMQIPEMAWEMTDNKQKDKLKSVWIKDPQYAYRYARMKNTTWPEAEPVIAQDAKYAYLYADYLLRSRFPAGEAAIARDPDTSLA